MKKKIFSVLFALVLVLTLGLVTAVPAAATATTVTLTPATTKGGTSIEFSLLVENTGATHNIVKVTLDVPPPGSGGSNHIVTDLPNGPDSWVANASVDGFGNMDVITWTGDSIAPAGNETFTFTATTPTVGATYNWDWTTTDADSVTVTGTVVTTRDPTSPTLNSIDWADKDGSTDINKGDTLLFTFSENMKTTTVGDTNIDTRLPLSGGGSYGTSPTVDWTTPGDDATLTVTLGASPTVVSGDTVNPTDEVTDAAGNPDATVPTGEPAVLPTITDDESPTLNSIDWTNVGPDTYINEGDTLKFTFSEAMDTSTVTLGTLGSRLPLSAGSYGDGATLDWGTPAGDDTLTVTLGANVSILSGATVNPDPLVTDAAGNADGSAPQAITDAVKPFLRSIVWTDAQAPVGMSEGDVLRFTFSEPMDTTVITYSNINAKLPTSGGKSYGSVTAADIVWTSSDTVLSVTLGALTTIAPDETVNPDGSVVDKKGNADNTISPPAIVQVTVEIVLPAPPVYHGTDIVVDVNISSVTLLDAASYTLRWKSYYSSFGNLEVLDLTDVTAGTIGGVSFPISSYSLTGTGTRYLCISQNISGTTGASGSGTMVQLHFTVIGASGFSTDIKWYTPEPMLSDTGANQIYANWEDATLDVYSGEPGDANGDGLFNAQDITEVELIVAEKTGHPQTPGADANEDKAWNALDITKTELIVAVAP